MITGVFKNYLHFRKVKGVVAVTGLQNRDLELLNWNPLLSIAQSQEEFKFEFSRCNHTLAYLQNWGYVIVEHFTPKIFRFVISANLYNTYYFLAENKGQITLRVRHLNNRQISHPVHFLRYKNHSVGAWSKIERDCVLNNGVDPVFLMVLYLGSMLDVTCELFSHFLNL